MSAHPHPTGPAREVIAPPHLSLSKEVGRPAGPPPLEYGEVRLWLVAKDSHALFAYWELRPEDHPEAAPAGGAPARFYLRTLRVDGSIAESTQEIEPAAGQCTTTAGQSDTLYRAELGFFNAQGVWCFLAQSGPARTPPEDPNNPKVLVAAKPSASAGPAASAKPSSWSSAQEAGFNAVLTDEVAQKNSRSQSKDIPDESRTGNPAK